MARKKKEKQRGLIDELSWGVLQEFAAVGSTAKREFVSTTDIMSGKPKRPRRYR
ncbi:hypothetical protein [Sphingorhabdus sp. Alg231-15]|uniref:hypothetical protein n=1 Tax=Sphingorhabdus sp. Alg231-15 TaxID=1922222 RepID=UPI00307CC485